jgi:hypothetical protein
MVTNSVVFLFVQLIVADMASSSEAVMPVLLRKPRAPKQAPVAIQLCSRKTELSSIVKPPTCRTSAVLSQTCEEFTDMGQYELQAPIYFEKTRPRSPVIVEADKIPNHHTSLQEIPSLSSSLGVISRSLVKPTKVRGPDPLPAREPRKKPTIIHVPLDEDMTRYYREPEFSLNDFIIQFSNDEHLPVENIEQTMFSRYTYDRLQNVLHERCFPKTASLSVQKLQLPDHLSVGPRKIPYRLLVAEMALAIKEQINQVVVVDVLLVHTHTRLLNLASALSITGNVQQLCCENASLGTAWPYSMFCQHAFIEFYVYFVNKTVVRLIVDI